MTFTDSNITNDTLITRNEVQLCIKREDVLHPHISGNKYRKLKYNINFAKTENYTKLLTFGGAFSNHIAATAAAGKEVGLQTIGVIRGEELAQHEATSFERNPTLQFAQQYGMQFQFVSRSDYRKKEEPDYIKTLQTQHQNPYIIPEGGTNKLAIKGCQEILKDEDSHFDIICCAAGTGGTAAGIINSLATHQKLLTFSALKGDFLKNAIQQWVTTTSNWELITDYHFGGYAKYNTALIAFINTFVKTYKIPLDPIYTGKMMYGIFDLIDQGYFPPKTRILAIHTGGIQGIAGINQKLQQKGLKIIDY